MGAAGSPAGMTDKDEHLSGGLEPGVAEIELLWMQRDSDPESWDRGHKEGS